MASPSTPGTRCSRQSGIDRSFYAPSPTASFRRYGAQLPDGFHCVSKALHAVVGPRRWSDRRPRRPRTRRGASLARLEPNPDFLSVPLFLSRVAAPLLTVFRAHAGPGAAPSCPRSALPTGSRRARSSSGSTRSSARFAAQLSCAVELRERAYFTGEVPGEITGARGVAHAYSATGATCRLPGPRPRWCPSPNAPFAVVRLSLKPGRRYEGGGSAGSTRSAGWSSRIPRCARRSREILCENRGAAHRELHAREQQGRGARRP